MPLKSSVQKHTWLIYVFMRFSISWRWIYLSWSRYTNKNRACWSYSGVLVSHARLFSLRKQPTFRDATAGFPAKWRLRKEWGNYILMTCHYPDMKHDFLHSFLRRHLPAKTSSGAQNVGCSLRLPVMVLWLTEAKLKNNAKQILVLVSLVL